MEDSYTVHRRRKAAARRREKTPEPPKRDEESGEDESKARAKMEKMVEDTENMAENAVHPDQNLITHQKENRTSRTPSSTPKKKSLEDDVSVEQTSKNIAQSENAGQNQTRSESEVKTVANPVPMTTDNETITKFSNVAEETVPNPLDSELPSISAGKDVVDVPGEFADFSKPSGVLETKEPRSEIIGTSYGPAGNQGTEPLRPKKRSRDKHLVQAKKSYGSDSSDADQEKVLQSIRRKKSPEGPRAKGGGTWKSQSRSHTVPTDTDEDRNTSNNESRSKPIHEKRHASKHRYSTGTEDEASPRKGEKGHRDPQGTEHESSKIRARSRDSMAKSREKRSVSRHRYPSDTDDQHQDLGMIKSETFPQKSLPDQRQVIKRSNSEMKKQIIPLSDDSLIQDFAKAQEDYLKRDRSILESDPLDDTHYFQQKTEHEASIPAILRKRKVGVLHADPEEILKTRDRECKQPKQSWFSRFINIPFSKKKEKTDEIDPDQKITPARESYGDEKVSFMEFLRALREIVSEFKAFVNQNPQETAILRKLRNSCIAELILIIIYCGLGTFVFRFTEGAFETFYKCGVKRVKRDFLDNLWNYSHNMREEDWKSMARRKLMEFEEQLHNAHEAGVHSYSGQKNWTFLNAVVYCLTVITTIGYGHISPRTLTGRAITIVYAIFGIPMFLIILADFGKLFTRGIKFLWAFVRRLYYTGSCRKVRRTAPVQEVMKGVQLVYDFATFRRPSQMNPEDVEEIQRQKSQPQAVFNLDGNMPIPDTPGTPAMSNFAIDDEFNLPISVAISILLGYIFVGATVYHIWENWGFFESFYFVFISMSTIGFGDFVPEHPMYMMCSIVYLVFGLALTSMCINVVQTMLSDSFKQASQKISATIGFEVPAEEGAEDEQAESEPVDISDVQVTIKEPDNENKEAIAPKAKQEDIDL